MDAFLDHDLSSDDDDLFWSMWHCAGSTLSLCRRLDARPGLLKARTGQDLTPLMFAARHGPVSLLKVIIQRGPDMEATDHRGWRALHFAVEGRRPDEVALLIRSGADVLARTARGSTALILAAGRGGGAGMVECLLDLARGRGLDSQDDEGRTALYWACMTGNLEATRMLLYAGADRTVADVRGNIPMMAATAARTSGLWVLRCLERWESSLERRYLLCKARSVQDTHASHLRAPALPLPGFLQARVASVAITVKEEKDGEQIAFEEEEEKQAVGRRKRAVSLRRVIGKRKKDEHRFDMRLAVVMYALNDLPSELFVELMGLFRKP